MLNSEMQKYIKPLLAICIICKCVVVDAQTPTIFDQIPKPLPAPPANDTLVVSPQAEEIDIAGVVRTAESLSDPEAYKYLLNWVVPPANRGVFRMQFVIIPLEEQSKLPPATAEIERFKSPAMKLISIAKRLNKLNDLLVQVNAVDESNAQNIRAKAGMSALIYAHQREYRLAKSEITKLSLLAAEPLPNSYTLGDRAPEFYAVLFGGMFPELYYDAWVLGTSLRSHERDLETHATDGNWERLLNGALSTIMRRNAPNATSAVLKQWTAVPNITGQQAATGLRPSQWRMEDGTLKHDGGETWSSLYFQSPLRGKFEIVATRSTFDYGEMLISVGMHSAEPQFDLASHRVHRALLGSISAGEPIEMPFWQKMARFRIVVDENRVTTYTNDVLIHDEEFSAPIDPWLVLQAEWPWFSTTVKSLEIRGTPFVPEEIDLVDTADAGGWRVNFYEYSNYPNPIGRYHTITSNEIRGSIRRSAGQRKIESFLKYSRPMLEDGEFEYEFYFEPGKSEVHPVMGKYAVMLTDDATKLHPLSNGPTDRSGATPDTIFELEDAKAPTLKHNDWNHVILQLRSDQLTILVNGEAVATHHVVEPPNERFFGFFRYVNLHEIRVRSAKYRGEWPKVLPPIDQQELAIKR